jgi:hypothetical protein
MRFFACKPVFFFSRDGRPKSEDRCTGQLRPKTGIKLDILSSGIIAYIHRISKQNFEVGSAFDLYNS